jgi:hypothetical protein
MDDEDYIDEDYPNYRPIDEIDMWELPRAIRSLPFFQDTYLQMQATNLGLIDRWLMDVEAQVLQRLIHEERTPMDDAMFLNAQSQMWFFAAYELLRTWRQRAKEAIRLIENGGLDLKIDALESEKGYTNFGKNARAAQLKALKGNGEAKDAIEEALRRLHIPFARLEALRVSLAKHEVVGKPKMPISAPGYARIDRWTGSLSYELGGGRVILGYITRRDISDELRTIADADAPTNEEIEGFDEFMAQLGDETSLEAPDNGTPF